MARNPQKSKPTTRKLRPKDRPLENDFISDDDFEAQLEAWFGNIARVLEPGRSFYIWGGWSNVANYPPVLKRVGLFWHQQIIWVKNQPVLCRKDFMLAHEWCFYGWREGAAHVFLGLNNVPDVWSIKKVNSQSMIRLTEAPSSLGAKKSCRALAGQLVAPWSRPANVSSCCEKPQTEVGYTTDMLRLYSAAVK